MLPLQAMTICEGNVSRASLGASKAGRRNKQGRFQQAFIHRMNVHAHGIMTIDYHVVEGRQRRRR
jgi:hypothetical protein